jgi:hypothetical protein
VADQGWDDDDGGGFDDAGYEDWDLDFADDPDAGSNDVGDAAGAGATLSAEQLQACAQG